MKNGEWEKVVSEQETLSRHLLTVLQFCRYQAESNEVATSLFCLKTKKNVPGKISNAKCLLAVIPESFG
jgi:hypothetical protein